MYFHYLKIVRFLHPGYHPEIIGNVQKNGQKQGHCFKEFI